MSYEFIIDGKFDQSEDAAVYHSGACLVRNRSVKTFVYLLARNIGFRYLFSVKQFSSEVALFIFEICLSFIIFFFFFVQIVHNEFPSSTIPTRFYNFQCDNVE